MLASVITLKSFSGKLKRLIMLKNFSREYNVNRMFLSIIGFWPFQSGLARKLLPTFCFLLEISYFPFEILILYDHWDNVQMIFDAGYQIVLTTACIVRILSEVCNQDRLRRLYKDIDKHWDIFTNDVEVQVLKDYSMLSRKFTIYYSMLLYAFMSGFIAIPLTPAFLNIIQPLVNQSRPRSFAVEVEFRVNKDEYFVPIFCYITALMVVGINIMVGVDTMHITCTAHACSLFSAVSKQVENIISKVGNNQNNNEIGECGGGVYTRLDLPSEEIVYKEYIICLKKHQLALEFVNILNSSNQYLSLCLLFLITAILSIIGIRIVYVLDQLQELLRYMFIVMGALIQLIIVCYSGQKLMDESQNIFYRAYAAEWYNFSPRIKSLLIISLHRSIVPCGLMAGNIIPLSMTTYAGVVRMGMSYFTAFLSFKD
ncbi:odorant receptor Or2-like [Temnothorax americanus]|uniref:odorant receptor Or2-like n=1 Tax=Temnothorax americanus TaxID=1964332 RepID=UPI004068C78F